MIKYIHLYFFQSSVQYSMIKFFDPIRIKSLSFLLSQE
ncbi:Uncharacterized protein dnm_048330 [Desulfonema magnum]|uniref:Uncharacterized protein n=1 Tax=Desulfonema magnum TaxID=45655 RepID=A0A975BNI0_9BACT|nr:Uncharacterized protein dnm_048330 [Desulfonema magnum]